MCILRDTKIGSMNLANVAYVLSRKIEKELKCFPSLPTPREEELGNELFALVKDIAARPTVVKHYETLELDQQQYSDSFPDEPEGEGASQPSSQASAASSS